MAPKSKYAQLVDSIFGSGTAAFDQADVDTNEVIVALADDPDFNDFKAAFEFRLQRLNAAITLNPNLRKAVITTINQVARRSNWDGAFAELSTLDYFFSDPRTDAGKSQLDVTVPASETLAGAMGKSNANFDLVLPPFNTALDVKLLSDKSGSIIEGIINQVLNKKGISMSVIPSYSLAQSYDLFQKKRRDLAIELERLMDTVARPASGDSSVIQGLKYQFAWNKGVFSNISIYNPEQHARNHHTLLFAHAGKFATNRPSGIIFVHFPWSGEKIPTLGAARKRFFKELAEQFLHGYAGSKVDARQFNDEFKSPILASEVAAHLSIVIFLEDESVRAKDKTRINISASYFVNKSAKHTLLTSPLQSYLASRDAVDLAAM